ncbi:hypothetical protein SAMN04488592_2986, partial [Microbacterium azadirachtae]
SDGPSRYNPGPPRYTGVAPSSDGGGGSTPPSAGNGGGGGGSPKPKQEVNWWNSSSDTGCLVAGRIGGRCTVDTNVTFERVAITIAAIGIGAIAATAIGVCVAATVGACAGFGVAAAIAASGAAGGTTNVLAYLAGSGPKTAEEANSAFYEGAGLGALGGSIALIGKAPASLLANAEKAAQTGTKAAPAVQSAEQAAAARAASNVDDWSVSAKHLPGAAGRWNKWAEGVDINGTVKDALVSSDSTFMTNTGGAADSFILRTNMGQVVGTKGETSVKVVVSNDGRIITAYPVK